MARPRFQAVPPSTLKCSRWLQVYFRAGKKSFKVGPWYCFSFLFFSRCISFDFTCYLEPKLFWELTRKSAEFIISPALGIEPATSGSEVKRSTDWVKPTAVIDRCYKLIVTFAHGPGTHSGGHGTAKQDFWSSVGFDPGHPEAGSYLPGFLTFFLQDTCLDTTPWPHVVEHELQLVMCHLCLQKSIQ